MHITFVLWTAVYEISMNTTIALAAITLIAVVMVLGALAPVVMATPSSGDPKHNPKVKWCHFDRDSNDDGDTTTNDRTWEVLRLNTHSEAAHIAHGDLIIPGGVTEVNCNKTFLGDPDL